MGLPKMDDGRRWIIRDASSAYLKEAARLGQLEEDYGYEKPKVEETDAEKQEKLNKMVMQAEIDNEQATADYDASKKQATLAARLMFYGPIVGAANLPIGLLNILINSNGIYVAMLTLVVTGVAMVVGGYNLRPSSVRSDRAREIDTRRKLQYLYNVTWEQNRELKQLR